MAAPANKINAATVESGSKSDKSELESYEDSE